jgi:hypothetical protein
LIDSLISCWIYYTFEKINQLSHATGIPSAWGFCSSIIRLVLEIDDVIADSFRYCCPDSEVELEGSPSSGFGATRVHYLFLPAIGHGQA